MLPVLTAASFSGHIGERFELHVASPAGLEIELIEVNPGGRLTESDAAGGRRAPFSVVFRGPREPVLPQRIYELAHVTLGTLELFLVPIGPDDRGMLYEVVFG